jgi:uncharacterized OB-fold protein
MTIQPIRPGVKVVNEDPMIIENQKTWSHFHSYGGWGRFFQGLREGKLLATGCTNPDCAEKRLFLPPRCDCVDCWSRTEWVEAPHQGTIYTYSTVKYPGELFRMNYPCSLISVELEGVCTKFMSYLREGTPAFGMPVRAVFNTENPTNTILDIAWVPDG